ncbi:TPA: sorbosone dehydrogenase family protein [Klebsiella aerogenes]|nr:sorbosone dehydrogenase family protein [Klebsiella aerogenes]HCT8625341.1 sorbosone dehydrogenase family protein [Klebsiella aerogenes]HCT8634379.1 sorbosone dehydrogenase family protein [Klebsiella aerogenes]HCT8715191.1 sorbosone dehydrogenase family protein [Klebsiella aerogenes]HEM8666525.1 sorbosone dehydrogenase family protein [Klebsiella aerogenes]
MNKLLLPLPVMLATALALSGCDEKAKLSPDQQVGPDPVMPKAQDFLMPPMQVPRGVGWKTDGQPAVAQGLKIEKIADGFLHPRMVYVLPNDDVLVVESNGPGEEPLTTPKQLIAGIVKNQSGKGGKGGNRITLLRKNASGWEKHIFLEHLHSPFGVQLIGDNLYVANTGNIMRYHYQPGATHISDAGSELADLPSTVNHHWTKALLASPDGKKLYVGVGSNSNITENGLDIEYRRATVLEVDTATGASRIFASGIRNPTGLGWEPQTGKLWAIANERDEIGADLVPDYLTSVQDGGFYGWPWSYFGQHVDRRVQPPRPDMVAKAIKPDYALSSHVAPLGMLFYTGKMLPQTYQGGVFISEHGSWDRSPLNGYKVSFVAFKDGKPVGKPESVVTGFVSRDEKKLYGAPVGLAQDSEGALIIADDVGNTVWRVSAK